MATKERTDELWDGQRQPHGTTGFCGSLNARNHKSTHCLLLSLDNHLIEFGLHIVFTSDSENISVTD